MGSIEPPDLNDERWLKVVSEMEEASEAESDWAPFTQRLDSIRLGAGSLRSDSLDKAIAAFSLQVGFAWKVASEDLLPLVRRTMTLQLTLMEWIRLTADYHAWMSDRPAGNDELLLSRELLEGTAERLPRLSGRERREADRILSAAGIVL